MERRGETRMRIRMKTCDWHEEAERSDSEEHDWLRVSDYDAELWL